MLTALAAVAVVVGLIIGFRPVTADGYDSTNVHCGSAFIPDSAPSGTSDIDTWGNILGFQPTGGEDDPSMLQSICDTDTATFRTAALWILIPGVLVGLGILFGIRSSRKTLAREATSEAVELEKKWREKGWVPPEELDGPPPGWVQAHSGG
jgi:hypothetical protein